VYLVCLFVLALAKAASHCGGGHNVESKVLAQLATNGSRKWYGAGCWLLTNGEWAWWLVVVVVRLLYQPFCNSRRMKGQQEAGRGDVIG
jgi:hypothetical protein